MSIAKTNRTYKYIAGVLLLGMVFTFLACEPWNETAEVSHLSYLPQFEIIGGEFQSYVLVDSAEYEDMGAVAASDGEELQVYSSGEVDLTEVGVYIITYYAENADGLQSTAERIVAVTNTDVSKNDLSGIYEGTIWSPLVEMKLVKLHADGYYSCSDIMGFSGADMPGNIVDLGDHELYLIHGEGDFGQYSSSKGSYTLSSLSWTVGLLDAPYEGVEISVFWTRVVD